MSNTVDVVCHDINDKYPWPQDVAELIQEWSRPLPKRLASDEFKNIIPPPSRRTLEEVLQSPNLKLGTNDTSEGPPMPVSDVIDTVLSYVRRVRAACLRGRGQEEARMSWTSLILALGMAISEDVFLAQDIPFLTPRTRARSKPQQVEDLEQTAVVLLSVWIRRRRRDDDAADKRDKKRSVASSDRHPSVLDNSFLPIDVPLDAHILPGRGRRVDCCLPVVCAAKEDVIEALVTSVVCQRYVWNIPLPVVGVSLSKSGTSATIVIGWSEVASDTPDTTPVVHLLLPKKKDSLLPSLGRFDLLDPTSALYFGQFILGLYHQFTSLQEWSEHRRTREYCWRLDHVDLPCVLPRPKLDLPSNNESLVETWLSELPAPRYTKRSISHRLHSMFSPIFG